MQYPSFFKGFPAPDPIRALVGSLAMAGLLAVGACNGGAYEPDAAPAPGAADEMVSGDETTTATPEVLIAAPSLPGLTLLDQGNRQVVFEELSDKPTLLTFIYTRCPMPDMCPATMLRFQEVQKALTPAERERVRLISVSFDPLDTPDVLAEYGDLWEVDGSFWKLLTGTEENVQRLASSYGVWYEKSDADETFLHAMYSMILLPDGSLHKILQGSTFDSEEAAGILLSLANDLGSTTH